MQQQQQQQQQYTAAQGPKQYAPKQGQSQDYHLSSLLKNTKNTQKIQNAAAKQGQSQVIFPIFHLTCSKIQ